MRKAVYALAFCPLAVEAFQLSALSSLPSASSASRALTSSPPSLLTLQCSGDRVDRRQVMGSFAAASAAFVLSPERSFAQEAAPAEDDDGKRAPPRYNRQPTRLDIERTLPKIAPVKDVMDNVRGALKAGDLTNVVKVIGDPSIEATKKNVNLGKDISELSKAKSFMYRYAQSYSKGADSALTTDIKTGLDTFFAWMSDVRQKAISGDQKGAEESFTNAESAISYMVAVVEKECRDGRINSIPVSLSFLTGQAELDKNIQTYRANMEEMARRKKEM